MPHKLGDTEFFGIGEALEYAGLSRPTYFRWVKEGRIPDARHRDRNGRRVLTCAEVEALREHAQSVSDSPPRPAAESIRALAKVASRSGHTKAWPRKPKAVFEKSSTYGLDGTEPVSAPARGRVLEHHGLLANGLQWKLLNGDCNDALEQLEPASVHCVVTSPPYYWQRDYGVEGQIGHEPTISGYVEAIVQCFDRVFKVLRDDGVAFLNLGDTYYSAKGKPHGRDKKNRGRALARTRLRAVDGPGLGLPRKSLIGIPWRVALALQAAGWTLRSDVVWKRLGALPEPTAHDRPWLTHEHVFILTKRPRYWFDRSALRGQEDIWHIPPRPDNPGAHFAPFPSALVEKCIRCGCPPGGTVLDPFVGSGTSMLVGLGLRRNVIGIELNSNYCRFVRERIDRLSGEINLWPEGDLGEQPAEA